MYMFTILVFLEKKNRFIVPNLSCSQLGRLKPLCIPTPVKLPLTSPLL